MRGRPLESEIRNLRTNIQLVKNINRSIRTDYGGQKDKQGVIVNKMKQLGYYLSREQAEGVAILMKDQIEGVRKRTKNDRELLLERFKPNPKFRLN